MDFNLKDVFSAGKIRAYVAEFVGMFFFLYISVGMVVSSFYFGDVTSYNNQQNGVTDNPITMPAVLVISFGFGMMIMVLAYSVGQYSGGHFNPAVTVGLMIFGHISVASAIIYILCQCGGAILGVGFVKAFFPRKTANAVAYGLNQPSCPADDLCVSDGMAIGLEAFATMLLVYVVYGSAVDKNNDKGMSHMAAIPIGFTVFLAHLILIPVTGCGINPARSLGSAVIANNYSKLWIYIAGPFAGGIVGAMLHHFPFQCCNQPEEDSEAAPMVDAPPPLQAQSPAAPAASGSPPVDNYQKKGNVNTYPSESLDVDPDTALNIG